MSGRITATKITPGTVIQVERAADGADLVPSRRTRGLLTVTVTGKDVVRVPNGTQRQYLIHTDAGTCRPAPGLQTFTLVSLPADQVDAPAPATDDAATVDQVDTDDAPRVRTIAEVQTCAEPVDHVAGAPGCAPFVLDCNGYPNGADIATRPVTERDTTGSAEIARAIAASVTGVGRHTVTDVRTGYTDTHGRGPRYVRPVSVWSMLVDGRRVILTGYESHTFGGTRSRGCLTVDGAPVDEATAVEISYSPETVGRMVAWRVRKHFLDAADVDQVDAPALPDAGMFVDGVQVASVTRVDLVAPATVPAVAPATVPAPADRLNFRTVKADGFTLCPAPACGRKVKAIRKRTAFATHTNGINECKLSRMPLDAPAPASLVAPPAASPVTVDHSPRPVVTVKSSDPRSDMTREAELWGDMSAPGTTVQVVYLPDRRSAYVAKSRIIGAPATVADVVPADLSDLVDAAPATVPAVPAPSLSALAALIAVPAAVPAATAPVTAVATVDQVDAVTGDVVDAELVADDAVTGEILDGVDLVDADAPAPAPAGPVHLVDGVRHGLPSVYTAPADWSGPVLEIEGKDWRAMLKRTLSAWFPGVTFSVRGDWGSVCARWTGGPSGRAVDLVADMFAGRHFDGMTDSNSYRGAVVFDDGKGNATAYRIPGCFVSTSQTPDAFNRAAVMPVAEYVAGVGVGGLMEGDDMAGRFVPRTDRVPYVHEWLGGPVRELLNWLVSMGYDADTIIHGRDKREQCGAPRCALAAGHSGHVHRTDMGRVFLADLTVTRIRCTCGALAPYTPAAGSEVIVLEHTNPAGNRCRRSLATHGGGGEIRTADVRYAPADQGDDDNGGGWNGPDDVPPALPSGPTGGATVDQVDAPATVPAAPVSLAGLAALITGGRPAGLVPTVAQAAPSVPVGENIADVIARIRLDRSGALAAMIDEAERAGAAAHAAGGDAGGTWSPVVCRLQSQLDDTSDQGRADRGRILDAYRRGFLAAGDRAADAAAAALPRPAIGTVVTVRGWQETVFVTAVTATHVIGICGGGDGANVPRDMITGTREMTPGPAPAPATVDQVDAAPADLGDAAALVREGDDAAAYAVEHTRDGGTMVHGSSRGDGVWEILQGFGRPRSWDGSLYLRATRNKTAAPARLREIAEAIAAHTGCAVRMVCDNRAADVAERIADAEQRTAGRVESLQGRAVKAATAAHNLRDASDRATVGIPMGQPVLMGHHSQRKHENTLDRADSLRRKGYAAGDKAEYLEARADGAYWNAEAKKDPRAMTRRAERLEAEARRMERAGITPGTTRAETHAETVAEAALIRDALTAAAAAGVYVAWTRDDFRPGDLVNVGGHWHRVIRANATSVSVPWWGSRTPDTDTKGDTAKYDKVHGRRRDGWQLDRPCDAEWPAADAHNVERWHALTNRAARPFSESQEVENRRHVYAAQRIRYGLPADAPLSVLEAHRANDTENRGTEGRRAVALALVAIFDRLRKGESFDQVAASVATADVVPTWTMPAGTPVDIRIDQLQRGDIIAGQWAEGGTFGGGARYLDRSFSGPVAYVSAVDRRNEAGDFVTVRLESGAEVTGKTHRWFGAFPGGQDTMRVADLVQGERADIRGRDQFGRPTRLAGFVLSGPSEQVERGGARHPMLSLTLAEYPDGANGWRGQVFTETDAWCALMADEVATAGPLELAAEAGRAAHRRGDMRAPGIDAVVRDLIAGKAVGDITGTQIMKAFTDAYDQETDAATRAAMAE